MMWCNRAQMALGGLTPKQYLVQGRIIVLLLGSKDNGGIILMNEIWSVLKRHESPAGNTRDIELQIPDDERARVIRVQNLTDSSFDWLTAFENVQIIAAEESIFFANLVEQRNILTKKYIVLRSGYRDTPAFKNNWLFRLIMAKTLIHCYKHFNQWQNSPPGLGDFIRGTAHLHELLADSGIKLQIDFSQSGFGKLLIQDESYSFEGEANKVAGAEEYFVDHISLIERVKSFAKSEQDELYVCTNLGAWNRTTLPIDTKEFMRNILRFHPEIDAKLNGILKPRDFEVISVRCGDTFYNGEQGSHHNYFLEKTDQFIQKIILPRVDHTLVITSDNYYLKRELANRHGLLFLPHKSQHGAFNDDATPVALDLCLLSKSKFIYHINLWATWWSGFSHYTSIIFSIPSLNMRAPEFKIEEIDEGGRLTVR